MISDKKIINKSCIYYKELQLWYTLYMSTSKIL